MASPLEMDNLRGAIESCEGAMRWASDPAFMESLPEEARSIFRSGVIQCFEVAYDECRKSIQKWLRESDIPLRGNLFRDAGSAELIDDVEKVDGVPDSSEPDQSFLQRGLCAANFRPDF